MARDLKLIFVHVPKTAGVSLREAIKDFFTPDLVLLDYDDRPIESESPMNIDPAGFIERFAQQRAGILEGKAAVIGHFWIAKYQGVSADIRGTILRDPITRAISHYFYWRKTAFDSDAPEDQRVAEWRNVWRRLSLLEFAGWPAINSIYTDFFFRNVDMAQFDFIGSYDRLARDWDGTLAALGVNPAPIRRDVNRTADLDIDYSRRRADILNDHRLMAQLRDLFAKDLRFYERYAP
jgi:hypothetical protein